VSATLALSLDTERLDRVVADVLVAPFFASDRPLRGPAARADWRLCGWLSEELRAERMRGERGEAALLLTEDRLRSPWLLALGLGPRPGFEERALRAAAGDAVRRLVALRTASAAFALPAEGLSGISAERGACAFLAGALDALAERPGALALRLLVEPEEVRRVRLALAEASRPGHERVELRLVQGAAPARPGGSSGDAWSAAQGPGRGPGAWLEDPRSPP
jgi:hypothetical protein